MELETHQHRVDLQEVPASCAQQSSKSIGWADHARARLRRLSCGSSSNTGTNFQFIELASDLQSLLLSHWIWRPWSKSRFD